MSNKTNRDLFFALADVARDHGKWMDEQVIVATVQELARALTEDASYLAKEEK
jgi:hypothetical protein